MNATELFKAGRLTEAIDAQIKEVKAQPGDGARRLFLFELLAFSGDLDRARRQFEAFKFEQLEQEAAVQPYRNLLESEQLRRRLFTECLSPTFFGEPPEHVRLRLEAVKRLRENNPAETSATLTRADALVPPLRGKLNGKAFEGLRDCDDLFSGVLEVMAHGKYFWVPLEQIEFVAMKPPKVPRDLLWFPARLDLREGATGPVFLPVLYPNSHATADDEIKLGRKTDWQQTEGGPVLGVGARQFLVGDDSFALLDWQELALDEPAK